MNKTAVVIGCSSQDGLLQMRLLLRSGYFVIGICRDRRRFDLCSAYVSSDLNSYRIIEFDFVDFSKLSDLFRPYHIDEIYNFVGVTSIAESWNDPYNTLRVNTLFLVSLLEYVRNNSTSTKVFQAGSSESFITSLNADEDRFFATSPYGLSKLASYSLINLYRESFGIFVVNGILFNHESIFRREGFVSRKIVQGIKEIAQDQSSVLVLGNLDSTRDWGDAEDFVLGFHQVLQNSEPGNYIFRSGNVATVREVVEFCASCLGLDLIWKGAGIDEVGIQRSSGRVIIRVSSEFFRPLDTDYKSIGDFGSVMANPWSASVGFKELFKKLMEHDFVY